MKLLVIDGNSIVNRAFYGIKALTTKDGRYTNGIYGFLNILLRLEDECTPDAVAVAFDLREPTFRHKMFDGYKAGRHAMPPELASQIPVLKDLLSNLGYKCVELSGYEADDILGTLSDVCSRDKDNLCFLATGDRDSFQLIKDNVTVILPTTKMGQTVVTRCTPEYIEEKYGVTPKQMIDIKALQGDSSDNIPGVAGVGEKTATALIREYGSIDYIYEHLDELDIKQGVHDKLAADRDNAYLSYKLGTICKEVPIDTQLDSYIKAEGNPAEAAQMLTDLEMFKIIDRLGLKEAVHSLDAPGAPKDEGFKTKVNEVKEFSVLSAKLEKESKAVFICQTREERIENLCFFLCGEIYILRQDANFDGFNDFLSNGNIRKYTDDSKHLFAYANTKGIELCGVAFDASLAGYILNPSANAYDPLRLFDEYGKGKLGAIGVSDEDELVQQTAALEKIYPYILELIDVNNQADLLMMEINLAQVLASMEQVGFLIDKDGLSEFGVVIEARVNEIAEKIYEETGERFNLNSPKQLGEVLFEKMGLPGKKTKTGYSTKAEVLESLAETHPVVADILEYRTVAKLKSTYCDGLLKVIGEDGRIHSTFNQTETRTGRISSLEPNLQNIPVRKPLGSELRKFFIAKPGYTLIDADYSQIELRVLAHVANDTQMIEAFRSGDDIHRITAAKVFNVNPDEVTPGMRSNAKAVNFGIVYGIGAFSLSKDIGVTRAEAQAYIDAYLTKFNGVDTYMKNVIAKASKDGYVKTLYERRRYLPELSSSNRMLRAFGERVARNMPIQGTAADIIKIAMIKVYNRLRSENLDAELIMQVHDELIVEANDNIAEQVKTIVKEEMENACSLSVKLIADANAGKTWYDAKG